MWKWIVVVSIVVIGVVGYTGYNYAIKVASEVMVEQIEQQLLGEIDKYEDFEEILNQPAVKEYFKDIDINAIDTDKELPFTTKEEALKRVVKEFSVSEMSEMINQANNGSINMNHFEESLQEKLTDEEMEALKIVILKELMNKN